MRPSAVQFLPRCLAAYGRRVPLLRDNVPALLRAMVPYYGLPYEMSACALVCVICKCASVQTTSVSWCVRSPRLLPQPMVRAVQLCLE